MIKLHELTPAVYYTKSRDFQLFGRLFDTALNSVKASTDMIYTLDNIDFAGSVLVGLLASTLGFKQKHEYNVNQLKAVCSILPSILRAKGTTKALEMICAAILNAESMDAQFLLSKITNTDGTSTGQYRLILPQLQNMALFNDLLSYVWPAGLSLSIIAGGSIYNEAIATKVVSQTSAVQVTRVYDTLAYNTLVNSDLQILIPIVSEEQSNTLDIPEIPWLEDSGYVLVDGDTFNIKITTATARSQDTSLRIQKKKATPTDPGSGYSTKAQILLNGVRISQDNQLTTGTYVAYFDKTANKWHFSIAHKNFFEAGLQVSRTQQQEAGTDTATNSGNLYKVTNTQKFSEYYDPQQGALLWLKVYTTNTQEAKLSINDGPQKTIWLAQRGSQPQPTSSTVNLNPNIIYTAYFTGDHWNLSELLLVNNTKNLTIKEDTN